MPAMLQADVTHFLIDLAAMLRKAGKVIVLVVPPLQMSEAAG